MFQHPDRHHHFEKLGASSAWTPGVRSTGKKFVHTTGRELAGFRSSASNCDGREPRRGQILHPGDPDGGVDATPCFRRRGMGLQAKYFRSMDEVQFGRLTAR